MVKTIKYAWVENKSLAGNRIQKLSAWTLYDRSIGRNVEQSEIAPFAKRLHRQVVDGTGSQKSTSICKKKSSSFLGILQRYCNRDMPVVLRYFE